MWKLVMMMIKVDDEDYNDYENWWKLIKVVDDDVIMRIKVYDVDIEVDDDESRWWWKLMMKVD